MPVLSAQTHQEAGQGEGGGAHGQQDSPGQLGVQQVGQDGQQDGGEDEDQDEGWASQKLKFNSKLNSNDGTKGLILSFYVIILPPVAAVIAELSFKLHFNCLPSKVAI